MEFERLSTIGREALKRASEHLSILVRQRSELRGVSVLRRQSEGRAISGESDAADEELRAVGKGIRVTPVSARPASVSLAQDASTEAAASAATTLGDWKGRPSGMDG